MFNSLAAILDGLAAGERVAIGNPFFLEAEWRLRGGRERAATVIAARLVAFATRHRRAVLAAAVLASPWPGSSADAGLGAT